jgi:ATP-dependent Clp protease adaptor protein ClpS
MTTDTGAIVEEKIKVDIAPPSLWKVVFLNDDKTPMELVILILTEIFKHSQEDARKITLEIHNTGSGVAGVYAFEIAEQYAIEATNIARENGAPLQVNVEQE